MKKGNWTMCFKSLAALTVAAGLVFTIPASIQADTLPNGLYVGGTELGGMTKEEAVEKIRSMVDGMENQKITLVVDGQQVETTAKELGFHWSNPDAVEEAASAYQGGNLVRRYLNLKDLENNHVVIPLETALDQESIAAFVEEKCSSVVAQPQDASITRENGQFIITPSVVGKTVDVEATKKSLDEALAGGLDQPVTVTALVAETNPAVTTEDLETIQDVLGTFSTDFSSSGSSRATNLRVGASKINGHLLMPGETLSGYECMNPFTTANGYATAAAYENGQVVDSVGGGVCQIATTLYNAALQAEVEIAQRQNHSMIVTYVKPSQDAAIAGTYKDIKITNNYSTPIYVEGYTEGRTLTFTIYGKETRPSNRTFKYVSETLKVMDPGAPKEEVDPGLAPGARKQVQSAHKGMESRLWKYVYIDGVEQSREILHTDTYAPSKAIIKVGPKAAAAPAVTANPAATGAAPVESQPVQTEPQTEAVNQPVEGINGGPGVTKAPETQPAPAPAPVTEAAPAPAPAPEPAPAPAPEPAPEPAAE